MNTHSNILDNIFHSVKRDGEGAFYEGTAPSAPKFIQTDKMFYYP